MEEEEVLSEDPGHMLVLAVKWAKRVDEIFEESPGPHYQQFQEITLTQEEVSLGVGELIVAKGIALGRRVSVIGEEEGSMAAWNGRKWKAWIWY